MTDRPSVSLSMALPTPPVPRAAGKDRRPATPERGSALRAGLPVAGLGPWIGEGADGRDTTEEIQKILPRRQTGHALLFQFCIGIFGIGCILSPRLSLTGGSFVVPCLQMLAFGNY